MAQTVKERNNLRFDERNLCREICNRLKECDISRHQILHGGGIIALVFFLSSRIPNEDTDLGDNLSSPGDKS